MGIILAASPLELVVVPFVRVDQDVYKRQPLCYAAYWLLDAGVDWRADFSTFDVAPVDDALKLDYPVMVVCTCLLYTSIPGRRSAPDH